MSEDYVAARKDTETLNCPNCGGNLVYSPEKGALYCEHCDTVVAIPSHTGKFETLVSDYKPSMEGESKEETVCRCQNCGAVTMYEKKETAFICPFCGSSHVVKSEDMGGMKPQAVLPFRISVDSANQHYKAWMKKKFYAPKEVKKNVPTGTLKGIYLPSFTFDSDTFSNYKGRLGKHYTRTVGSGKNAHTVTETRWFRVRGSIKVIFDDVIVNASDKISQKQISAIEPYDTNNGEEYNSKFLQGFSAEQYTKKMPECFEIAKDIMKNQIRSKILAKYDYDVVDYLNIDSYYQNSAYKYVLLPIWFLNYKYKNKDYGLIMNGTTGKSKGTYPKSALKIAITVILALAVFVGLLILFLRLDSGDTDYTYIPMLHNLSQMNKFLK